MINARSKGATLGLVAVLTFTVAIIGVCFFFLVKLIGGHRELERATDSGNLNVAKQSLRSPMLKVFGSPPYDIPDNNIVSEIQKNFATLQDPSNGQLDLLVYDRLVAQTFIVACNAAADNGGVNPSQLGIQRAQQLIQLLNDPNNGVGVALARKLKTDPVLDTNFTNLAASNSVEMLKSREQTLAIVPDKDISFMVRSFASNVILDPAVLPPPFNQNNLSGDFYVKNGTPYFIGYQPLSVGYFVSNGAGLSPRTVTDTNLNALMAVPLRPGEEPHLVANTDFNNSKVSPLTGSDPTVQTRVPPNAFKSSGSDLDVRTLLQQSAVSCAIAGSLSATFPAVMQNGVIAVVNGAGTEPTTPGAITVSSPGCINANLTSGNANAGSAAALMAGIYVLPSGGASDGYAISFDFDCFAQFENKNGVHLQQYGTPLHGAELAAASDCFQGATPEQDALSLPPVVGASPDSVGQHHCTNFNSTPSESAASGQPYDSTCNAALNSKLTDTYGSGSAGSVRTACLSALEWFEATVMTARAGGGGIFMNPFNACTGLDAFPLDYGSFNNSTIAQTPAAGPTINQLIGPGQGTLAKFPASSANSTVDYNDVIGRMLQMKPNASPQEIQAIFNQPIALGAVKFISLNDAKQFQFTDQGGLPSYIDPNHFVVDGTPVNATTGNLTLVSSGGNANGYIDQNDDGGYPHPYDCAPDGLGTAPSSARWTPSCGMDNLLGVLRFQNCVFTGGGMNFDCPC